MRSTYVAVGAILCLIGVAVVFFQVSESCEDSTLAGAYQGYPWCSDVLDHINVTFVGVLVLISGAVVLGLGGPLHWLLEPASDSEKPGQAPGEMKRWEGLT